tara:strand:+ start:828 stop:992 length:165 start_codon:yes stop_codon:yes gene_type:complete
MSIDDRINKLERRVRELEKEARYDARVAGSVESAMQIIADRLGMSLSELYEGVR